MAAEWEARHLVGAAQAPFQHRLPGKVTEVGRGSRRQPRRDTEKVFAGPGGPSYQLEIAEEEEEEDARRLLEHMPPSTGHPVLPRPDGGHGPATGAVRTLPPLPLWWPPSAFEFRVYRPDRHHEINLDLLDDAQLQQLEDELLMSALPSLSELAARNDRLVIKCLRHYNSMHPGNQYEPAPGVVSRYCASLHDGSFRTHGNFVARRKRSGCFSFLPGPRTLFFFELLTKIGFEGVVSCVPLDEPVTEAYSLFGFRLGWGSRRDGSLDCCCKTCHRKVKRLVPFMGKTFPCGHSTAESLCEMCYFYSDVLHPLPEKFARGNGD